MFSFLRILADCNERCLVSSVIPRVLLRVLPGFVNYTKCTRSVECLHYILCNVHSMNSECFGIGEYAADEAALMLNRISYMHVDMILLMSSMFVLLSTFKASCSENHFIAHIQHQRQRAKWHVPPFPIARTKYLYSLRLCNINIISPYSLCWARRCSFRGAQSKRGRSFHVRRVHLLLCHRSRARLKMSHVAHGGCAHLKFIKFTLHLADYLAARVELGDATHRMHDLRRSVVYFSSKHGT